MALEQLNDNNETGALRSCAKSNSKWVTDLNVRAKTTQLLRRHENLCNLGALQPRAWVAKEIAGKFDIEN